MTMPALLLTALRSEAAILRTAGLTPHVVGVRAHRLGGESVLRMVTTAPGTVLLVGYAGGLLPAQHPGDVVVATDVRDERGHVIATARPAMIAAALAALRDAGLDATAGSLISVGRFVRRTADRYRLAATGAVAVDMESAPVALAARHALLVVRVLVDTPADGVVTAVAGHAWRLGRVLARAARAAYHACDCAELPTSENSAPSGSVEMATPTSDTRPPDDRLAATTDRGKGN
ncbi:hypothetical protein Acel_1698 [Acidothermus cellulolyticus 11B]|uniref:Nucleoside phosphorylase domain-containing protein n=1 Tax=Acidothermus cellulolyticus (strain ATCC 43068 / DSM 8971 / 11B) TaxID=351607 RepID=A0LVL0_ACIC1|nr:hypothetical protein [Acidothermus cellulolyticus]ABK53470.1 hypothetical protein Acel_1698 [Acidothermus cellulolyticus 11B]